MILITIFFVSVYLLGLLLLLLVRPRELELSGEKQSFYSLVIPARNEEKQLKMLFESLSKLRGSFEVLFVDDNSTDQTHNLMRSFQIDSTLDVQVLKNSNSVQQAPKKSAIALAIQKAKGNVIVTIDADCEVTCTLLEVLDRYYKDERVQMVCGGVSFGAPETLIEKLQALEQAALSFLSSQFIQLQRPFTCNGANLSYRKSAYEAVNGFAGIDHIASGDDELLMKKIVKRYPGAVFFQAEAWVKTQYQESWRSLLQQRLRWASKWKHGGLSDKLPGLFIFCLYGALIVSGVTYPNSKVLWSLMGLKLSVETLITLVSWRQMKLKKYPLLYVPLLFLAYPFYAIFIAALSNITGYQWKGRSLN